MFEVDWADPDCERVGERQARKQLERGLKKQKDDARSSHDTVSTRPARISTRTSTPSTKRHLSFFGSIGRKKTVASFSQNKEQESTSTKSESAMANGKCKRDSFRFSRATARSAAKAPENVPMVPENERSGAAPTPSRKGAADAMRPSLPETPDRSSKGIQVAPSSLHYSPTLTRESESMLSKTTQLTIPSLERPRVRDSVIQAAPPSIKFPQIHSEEGFSGAKSAKTTYQQGRNRSSVPAQIAAVPKATATPNTPRAPRAPPTFLSPTSPDDDASVSEFIDAWYTALRGPTRDLPKPPPDGTIRRGNVLLPPSLYRPFPVTPTRSSTKKNVVMPPTPPRIRFSADNPDDWKTPDEWARESSAANQLPVSIDEAPSAQEDEAWDLIAADLRDIHNQEESAQTESLIAADLREIHNQEPSLDSENS